ncbi:MAG TPA: hypothetical protein DHW64_02560 [Chitinophagaceae bacterium]|jgi:hypothetical protein|nr:hypothetical protein [Chitinophagaceae bacterium]
MRNTTKLKAVLQHYHIDLSMNDQELMVVNLFHKQTGEAMTFEDASYSKLISKAYSYMNKQLKETIKKI